MIPALPAYLLSAGLGLVGAAGTGAADEATGCAGNATTAAGEAAGEGRGDGMGEAPASTTPPPGALRCATHQVMPAANAATTSAAPASRVSGADAVRRSAETAAGTGMAGVCSPGTSPRDRSASARRSASRM